LAPTGALTAESAHHALRAIGLAVSPPTAEIDAAVLAQLKRSGELIARADVSAIGNELHALLKGAEHLEALRLLNDVGLLGPVIARLMPSTPATSRLANSPLVFTQSVRRFHLLDRLLTVCHEALPPGFTARHLSMLRHVQLLMLLSGDRRRFDELDGARIEETFNRLSTHYSSSGIFGFRVRIVTQACCRVMGLLSGDADGLREALARTFLSLGRYKGLLAALVIACEWLKDQAGATEHDAGMRAAILAIQRTAADSAPTE
jgi:hypothetical protein